MIRRLLLCCFSIFIIFMSCNKGLEPTLKKSLPPSELEFPIEVQGGDLSGRWEPKDQNSLQACLADPTQLEGMVDSLILKSTLSGSLNIEPDNSFQLKANMSITPTIIIGNMRLKMQPFTEELDEANVLEQPWSNAFIMPLHPEVFKIDTVGYTAKGESLTLVTLPVGFPGFESIEYYLIFRYQRSASTSTSSISLFSEKPALPSRNFGEDDE